MAPRVGQALREARVQRGIALNDVERVTGIRVTYLRALEEGRWDQLPEPGRADELISTYADYLGLDEAALLEDYQRSARGSRSRPVPAGVVRPAGLSRYRRGRPGRPLVLLGAGVVAVILLGVALVAALGSNGGGDGDGAAKPSVAERNRSERTSTTTTAPSTITGGTEVSVELTATADVWVCLVDADGSQPVNGETLTPGEARGPFTSRRFEMTLGNGSIELTANGDPVKVPPLAEPLSMRITPDGGRRLSPGAGPTCA